MSTIENRVCKKCGSEYPLTSEFFGHMPPRGDKIGLRWSCRKCVRENTARHSADNPELVKARTQRRQQHAKNATGAYEPADIAKIRKILKNCCRYCGNSLEDNEEIDHITPLSRGGSNNPENLTLACRRCNRDKRDKTLIEFLLWRKERNEKIRKISPAYENPDIPRTSHM